MDDRSFRRYKSMAFEDFFQKSSGKPNNKSSPKAVKPEPRPKPENPQKQKKPAAARSRVFRVLVVLLAAALLALLAVWAAGYIKSSGARAPVSSSSGERKLALNKKPGGGELTTEQAAAKICPCVVGIVQYKEGSLTESGEGSGIVMDASGTILTNYHVIEDAQRLEVVLQSGKTYTASVIGGDVRTDLAVVHIAAQNLKYATFGNSDQCRVGETVIAVGNPSGLQLAGSVTQGIISALNRNVDVGNGPMNLIQTDAAINPGNSGGALVNMYGQVVGINSAKIAQSGYEGLGFSIPINTAKPVVDSILQYGYVKGRVKLGLNCKEIDAVTAQLNKIPEGIYVGYVEPGTSAESSGMKADDIITAIDGVPVTSTDTFIVERDKHKPGDAVTLSVYRRSKKENFTAQITLMEDKGISTGQDSADW